VCGLHGSIHSRKSEILYRTSVLRKQSWMTEKVDSVDERHPTVVRNTRLHLYALVVRGDWPANVDRIHNDSHMA